MRQWTWLLVLVVALFYFAMPAFGSDIGPPGEAPVIAQMNQETLDSAPDFKFGLQSEMNVASSVIVPNFAGTIPFTVAEEFPFSQVVPVNLDLMAKTQDAYTDSGYLQRKAVLSVALRFWLPEGGEAPRHSMNPGIIRA